VCIPRGRLQVPPVSERPAGRGVIWGEFGDVQGGMQKEPFQAQSVAPEVGRLRIHAKNGRNWICVSHGGLSARQRSG
jgi:hypothetical protein